MRRYLLPLITVVFGIAVLGSVLYPSGLGSISGPRQWLAFALGAALTIGGLSGLLRGARQGKRPTGNLHALIQGGKDYAHPGAFSARALPPTPPAHFTGRAEKREKLLSELASSETTPAIILSGKSGIGKTALAQQLAEDLKNSPAFPGGLIWWTLGTNPDFLAAFSAWAAYANPQADVTHLPAESRIEYVREQLARLGRLCVILDDVRDEASAQTMLKALPPDTAILITAHNSNLASALNGSAHELSPLDESEALKLLTHLLAPLGKYEETAREIVRLTEGLPLALELVAGAAGTPSALPALAEQLRARPHFDNLQIEGETGVPGIETCLAATYTSLPAPITLKARFRALGIFPAVFDEAALYAVWDEADTEAINILLRRHLLNKNKQNDLLSLHPLLHAYAMALLQREPAEESQAAQRHAAYFLEQANQVKIHHSQGGEAARIAQHQFNALWPHLQSAHARMLRLLTQGKGTMETRWLCDFPEKVIYALDLHIPPEETIAILETALEAARRLNDKQSESIHLVNLGIAFSMLGNLRKAIEHYENALPLKRDIGDLRGEGRALGNLGLAYTDLGEIRKAIEYYLLQLTIAHETGDRINEAATLRNLGMSYAAIGNSHRAIEFFQQALAMDREIGDRRNEGRSLGYLGLAYADRRNAQKAIEYYEKALKVSREIGDRRGEGSVLGNLGIIYYDLGDVYSAIEYYEQHLNITRLIGDRRGEGNALGNLGIAYKKLGDPYMAMEYYEQALVLDQAIGDKLGEANDCWNMGLLYEEQGNLARAAELMQVRVDYLESIGHADANKYARYLEDLQKKLALQAETTPEN